MLAELLIFTAATSAAASLLFLFRTYKYYMQTMELYESLSKIRTDINKLSTTVSFLENDFMEKYDNALRRMANRKAIRERRDAEEAEDSNRNPILVPV